MIGTTIEEYDFFLYGVAAPILLTVLLNTRSSGLVPPAIVVPLALPAARFAQDFRSTTKTGISRSVRSA